MIQSSESGFERSLRLEYGTVVNVYLHFSGEKDGEIITSVYTVYIV